MDTAKKKTKRTNKQPNAGGPVKDKMKAVVRRLPPNLPEDVFWQSVLPWIADEGISWKAFYPGKVRKAYNKLSTPSRAYIAFKSGEQLLAFSQAYDGHTFRDKTGQETHAVVEFAPCQKVPSEKKKVDPRIGTIEQDEDYISFIATLNAPMSKPGDSDNLEFLVASTRPPPSPKTTPLLEALQAERTAAKDKEAILKAHAHYRDGRARDVMASGKGTIPSRKEEKRKTAATKEKTEEQRVPAPTASPSKRSRRSRKADSAAATSASASTSAPVSQQSTNTTSHSKPSAKSTVAKPPRTQVASNSNAEGESKKSDKPPDQPQRTRPTITLQSRQFEAALSGAIPRVRREREASDSKSKDNASGDKEPAAPSTGSTADAGGGRPRRGGTHDRGSRRGGARSPTGPARSSNDGFGRIDDSLSVTAPPKDSLRPPVSGQPSGSPEANSPSRGRKRGGGRGSRGAAPSPRGNGPQSSTVSGDG